MSDHATSGDNEHHDKKQFYKSKYFLNVLLFCLLLIIVRMSYNGDGKFSIPDLWPFGSKKTEEVTVLEIPSLGQKSFRTDNTKETRFKLKIGHTDSIYFYNVEFPSKKYYFEEKESTPKESDGAFTDWVFNNSAYQIQFITIKTTN